MSPWDWGQQIIWDTKWTLLYKECLRSCSPLHSRVTVFWVGRVWCVSFPSSLLDVPSTLGCCFCIGSLCPPCAPATPHFDHSLGRPPPASAPAQHPPRPAPAQSSAFEMALSPELGCPALRLPDASSWSQSFLLCVSTALCFYSLQCFLNASSW